MKIHLGVGVLAFRGTVRYDLEPTATGTRLRVTHTGFGDRDMAAAGTGEGWKRILWRGWRNI